MTYHEKLVFYATAKRARVGTIGKIEDGNFVDYFVGKLRGKIVSKDDRTYKFVSKTDALNCARDFRKNCRTDAVKLGLLSA